MKIFKNSSVLLIALYIASASFSSAKAEIISEPASEAAILIDADTGTVLYEKNADEKLFPASVTKVMTALILLERAKDFNERAYFSAEAVYSLPYDSSNIAMNEGETLTLDQCMEAMMLESANEVSNAVAEHIGGSNEGFAVLMNDRAKKLGAVNTHFTNPHGLHDEEHYTTARDMALIFKAAAKNENFLHYISLVSSFIPPTEKQELERPLNNSNKLIIPGSAYYNENVIGGKTGFTNEAMHTLTSIAEKDGARLIAVVMKGKKNEPYADANALYEYGFLPETLAAIPPADDPEPPSEALDRMNEIDEAPFVNDTNSAKAPITEAFADETAQAEAGEEKRFEYVIIAGLILILLALAALLGASVVYYVNKVKESKRRRDTERYLREKFGRPARRNYKYKY
jgi:D-alanyl-D-alanine carboxypeptidase